MTKIQIFSLSIFVLLIIHQQGETDAARILGLFPLQGKSHYFMCETIMRALAARGHQVDVVSHFPLKNPPPNWRDISLAGTLPNIVGNLTYDMAKQFSSGGTLKKLIEMGGNTVCALMDTPQIRNIIENPPTDPPYDLVINELFSADCYLAFGRHLKVPVVGVVTSKLLDWMSGPIGNPLQPAYVPNIFSGYTQKMTFFERLQNTLLTGLIRTQYWYYISAQESVVEKHFGIKVSHITELYKDISIMLVNSHPSFDFVRPYGPNVVEVGGLHVTDGYDELSPELQKWLDESKSGFIYVSFGSMVKIESFPVEMVKAMYTSFERIAPIRVLMKIAKKEELPPGLPKNVKTLPWLPQTRVLQHKNVKAFVTHGGLGSTQESITYGVPMIQVPIFGDQRLNARLCEAKNIGIMVAYDKITADEFTKTLNEIIKNPVYRDNTKQVAKLWLDRPMKAIDTATFWIEHVLRNGNVFQSPAVDLYWWQVELLDVYAFLIAVILLALYILKRLIGFVLCLLCSKAKTGNASVAQITKSKKNK